MPLPTIEIYSDIHCPWTYLAIYRLRLVWPEYAGRVGLAWRALSLEYINRQGAPKPLLEVELDLIRTIEPRLPIRRWPRPDWQWPVTFWPAFEALACAQAQGHDAAYALSWALRHAFFAEGRSPALRHELLAIAEGVAAEAGLDLARFEEDWDGGRYKAGVIVDSRRGWHTLKVGGSPTFVLPSGRQITSPAAGDTYIDEERGIVRSYTAYEGDPLAAFRALLDEAVVK
ncbi:MAG TPA: DsbA family protein [Roseiflexaceae bacterium]|nr:DsbA family protein [Roseiflexaceae bacterium]